MQLTCCRDSSVKRRRALIALLAVAVAQLLSSCGSRTSLHPSESERGASGAAGDPGGPMSCLRDSDCGAGDACRTSVCADGVCSAVTLECDDGNPCTEDRCAPEMGCTHRPSTPDHDGDGRRAARVGVRPGAPDACGDDCDDTDPRVFPGAREVCDALDNDCNGIVDDGIVHVPSTNEPRLISSLADESAALGGIVGTETGFIASYSGRPDRRLQNLLVAIDTNGRKSVLGAVTSVNADSFAGPIVNTGFELATTWEDARQDGNYEIYFARFSTAGAKLGPDVRVTNAPRFSLHPQIAWTGSEYLIVWDDRRAEASGSGDLSMIYAQRVGADGALLGPNMELTPNRPLAESPDIALSSERVGVVFVSFDGVSRAQLRIFDQAFAPLGAEPAPIGEDVQGPSVHWLRDRFVVLFGTYAQGPGDALWGAAFDRDGRLIVGPKRVTSGARFMRSHDALVLGDRLLIVWADDFDGNYELYSQVLSPDLNPLSARQRLTNDPSDTLGPSIALGPAGKIGVAFNDYREGSRHVYLTTLDCPPAPPTGERPR